MQAWLAEEEGRSPDDRDAPWPKPHDERPEAKQRTVLKVAKVFGEEAMIEHVPLRIQPHGTANHRLVLRLPPDLRSYLSTCALWDGCSYSRSVAWALQWYLDWLRDHPGERA